MKLKLLVLLFLSYVANTFATGTSTNMVFIVNATNLTLPAFETNFFSANSNLLNQSVSGGGGGSATNASLVNGQSGAVSLTNSDGSVKVATTTGVLTLSATNAGALSGTLPLAVLPPAVVTNQQQNVTINGSWNGSAVNVDAINLLGQSAPNSNMLQYCFYAGSNSNIPLYTSTSIPTNDIMAGQLQSVAFDCATSNIWLGGNGNRVLEVSNDFLTGGALHILQSNTFAISDGGWGACVGTSCKVVGTNLAYLLACAVTPTSGQPYWAQSNVLVMLNTNGLTVDHIVTLGPIVVGGVTCSNIGNCLAWNSNANVLYVGLQFGGAGWPSNSTPGQVPFWDTIASYAVSTNSTWTFLGFVNVDKYQISTCALLDYNYNDGFIYEGGIDYLTSTSPNLSSGGENGQSIFKVSLTGHTTPIHFTTNLTQDGCFVPSLGPYALAQAGNGGATTVVPTYDMGGQQPVFAINRGVITLTGNNGGDILVSQFSNNVALGFAAGLEMTSAYANTLIGNDAAANIETGTYNTAVGYNALDGDFVGNQNTAIGAQALQNATGSGNIALGQYSGSSINAGNNNIDIGNVGVSSDSGIIRIGTTGTHTATYISGSMISSNGMATVISSPSWDTTGTNMLADANNPSVNYVTTNNLNFGFATNGLSGYERLCSIYLWNPAATNRTLIFPAAWTNYFNCSQTNTLLPSTITGVHFRFFGDTSASGSQTNLFIKCESSP